MNARYMETETRPVVLVVDDAPEYVGLLGSMLAPHYTVRVATSGRRALELAAQEPLPDVVLLDVLMPDMDGHAVLAQLRGDPRTADIPAVFLTSLDAERDEVAGLALGAVDYIAKPGLPALVHARVQAQIELKRARDHLRRRNEELAAEVQRCNRLERSLQETVANLQAFSYTVSHDLRAPLQAIGSFAALVRESEAEALSGSGRRYLDRIVERSRDMEAMIQDILACARAESVQMECCRVDTFALVTETVAHLRDSYPAAQVHIGELPVVRGDAAMLRQVFANLIGNALKFSRHADRPCVQIDSRSTAEGLEISVRDNGAGFDAQHAHKLFGLFQRLHTQQEFPGTGVGLAIVKRLVARHGGAMRAACVAGSWTTFTMILPAQAR